jgi:hypothetical protein
VTDNSASGSNDGAGEAKKRTPIRSLTADEYLRETGRSLIAFPLGNIALSGPRQPTTPTAIEMENAYLRLLMHADDGRCSPLLPPPPAPRTARWKRLERHWDAMWEWAKANGATSLMRFRCDDNNPMIEANREAVVRMEREIPQMPQLMSMIV